MKFKRHFPRLYRLLSRIRFGLSPDRVITLPQGGLMLANRYSYVERLIAEGGFERERAAFLAGQMHPGFTFVDIGANVGFYSVIAVARGLPVHCFEPEPINLRRLEANLALNHPQPGQVTLHPFALGAATSEARLSRPLTDNYGMATLQKLEAADSIVVPIRRLDEVLPPTGSPCFFKVDVEGFELQVLAGSESLHASLPPGSTWAVEVHTGCGVDPLSVADFFATRNYSVAYFDDHTRQLRGHLVPGGDLLLVAIKK